MYYYCSFLLCCVLAETQPRNGKTLRERLHLWYFCLPWHRKYNNLSENMFTCFSGSVSLSLSLRDGRVIFTERFETSLKLLTHIRFFKIGSAPTQAAPVIFQEPGKVAYTAVSPQGPCGRHFWEERERMGFCQVLEAKWTVSPMGCWYSFGQQPDYEIYKHERYSGVFV